MSKHQKHYTSYTVLSTMLVALLPFLFTSCGQGSEKLAEAPLTMSEAYELNLQYRGDAFIQSLNEAEKILNEAWHKTWEYSFLLYKLEDSLDDILEHEILDSDIIATALSRKNVDSEIIYNRFSFSCTDDCIDSDKPDSFDETILFLSRLSGQNEYTSGVKYLNSLYQNNILKVLRLDLHEVGSRLNYVFDQWMGDKAFNKIRLISAINEAHGQELYVETMERLKTYAFYLKEQQNIAKAKSSVHQTEVSFLKKLTEEVYKRLTSIYVESNEDIKDEFDLANIALDSIDANANSLEEAQVQAIPSTETPNNAYHSTFVDSLGHRDLSNRLSKLAKEYNRFIEAHKMVGSDNSYEIINVEDALKKLNESDERIKKDVNISNQIVKKIKSKLPLINQKISALQKRLTLALVQGISTNSESYFRKDILACELIKLYDSAENKDEIKEAIRRGSLFRYLDLFHSSSMLEDEAKQKAMIKRCQTDIKDILMTI